jgi:hypothetical protein
MNLARVCRMGGGGKGRDFSCSREGLEGAQLRGLCHLQRTWGGN